MLKEKKNLGALDIFENWENSYSIIYSLIQKRVRGLTNKPLLFRNWINRTYILLEGWPINNSVLSLKHWPPPKKKKIFLK